MHRPHFSPALVLAALALFLAAGGSGYALGHKAAAPQPRCAAGAVRGIAVVTGDPLKGIENLSGDYSSAAKLFGYRFNCSGRGVQVRKSPSLTSVDVRFVGNASRIAIVNAIGSDPAGVSVAPQPDGSFRVSLAARSDQPDGNSFGPKALGFVIVAL